MTPEVKARIEQIRHGIVPEGYHISGNRVSPIDWEIKRLSDICEINPVKGSDIPDKVTFLGMADAGEDGKILNQNLVDYVTVKNGFTAFKRNDILIAKITPCFENGKGAWTAGLITEYGFGSTEFHVLRSSIDGKFLFYHTVSDSFRKRLEHEMVGSAGQKRVQEVSLANYSIAVPPSKEQKAIAEILTTQDKIIELKERLLAEKQQQKKYLMQQLLTGKKRLSGFDGAWTPIRLSQLLSERNTYSQKGLEYPHVTLSTEGIYAKSERYDRDHLVKSDDKAYKITRKGDICYNPANLKFGVICVNTFGDAIFSPIYVTFEVVSGVSLGFLSNYLMRWDFINAVRKYEEGTVYERMAVKPEDFLRFEIQLPTLAEQEAIAAILEKADEEIAIIQRAIEQEKQKKKALMQLLLTGIVRV